MEQRAKPSARTHLIPFFISVAVLWALCFIFSRPGHWYAMGYMAMAASILRWFGWTRDDAPGWVLVFLGVPAGLLLLLFAWIAIKTFAA